MSYVEALLRPHDALAGSLQGGDGPAQRLPDPSIPTRCSLASTRGAPTRTCGSSTRKRSPPSIWTATPWAAWRWGEPKEEMYRIIGGGRTLPAADKPRYLMGVGTPVNIIEGVWRGIDLFDCVMPSRNARHGHLFTWEGIRNINNRSTSGTPCPSTPSATAPSAAATPAPISATSSGPARSWANAWR